jgi:hypothetical protein
MTRLRFETFCFGCCVDVSVEFSTKNAPPTRFALIARIVPFENGLLLIDCAYGGEKRKSSHCQGGPL